MDPNQAHLRAGHQLQVENTASLHADQRVGGIDVAHDRHMPQAEAERSHRSKRPRPAEIGNADESKDDSGVLSLAVATTHNRRVTALPPAEVDEAAALICAEHVAASPIPEAGPTKRRAIDPAHLILSIQRILQTDITEPELRLTMYEGERRHQPDQHYMDFQREIDGTMRAILFDWMLEVSQEFALGRETVHLAINYVDRFLSKEYELQRTELQLLGVTSLFIASKLEEIYPPKAADFVVTTDNAYTLEDVFRMEARVLGNLQWHLAGQTPYSFFKFFIRATIRKLHETVIRSEELDATIHQLLSVESFMRAMVVVDAAVHELKSLQFKPSELALSVLLLIHPRVTAIVPVVSGYDIERLRPCIDFLTDFLVLRPLPLPGMCRTYEEIKLPVEDIFTRQVHHPEMLNLFRQRMLPRS